MNPLPDNPRLLIVDDEEDILQAVAAYLEGDVENLQVATACGGREALQMCEEDDFDIVLSDFRMPEMDGLAFLTELHRRRPEVAGIMMTAYPDDQLRRAAKTHAGVRSFFPKPLDLDRLTATLRDLISGRPGAAG